MKNLSTPFTLSLLIAFSVACTSKSTEDNSGMENTDNPEMHETTPSDIPTDSATTVAFKDESTTRLVQGYLAVKDALVASNGTKAQSEAKKLEELLTAKEYSAIKVDIKKIAETSDPVIQRQSFLSLSEQVLVLTKNTKLSSGNLFIQHCPMIDGNKGGNWLSLSEDIKNPYYGDKMLTCGSVTEQL